MTGWSMPGRRPFLPQRSHRPTCEGKRVRFLGGLQGRAKRFLKSRIAERFDETLDRPLPDQLRPQGFVHLRGDVDDRNPLAAAQQFAMQLGYPSSLRSARIMLKLLA